MLRASCSGRDPQREWQDKDHMMAPPGKGILSPCSALWHWEYWLWGRGTHEQVGEEGRWAKIQMGWYWETGTQDGSVPYGAEAVQHCCSRQKS